jgi:hypothetical protein
VESIEEAQSALEYLEERRTRYLPNSTNKSLEMIDEDISKLKRLIEILKMTDQNSEKYKKKGRIDSP